MRRADIEVGKVYGYNSYGREASLYKAHVVSVGDKLVTIRYDELEWDYHAEPGARNVVEIEVRAERLIAPWGEIRPTIDRSNVIASRKTRAKRREELDIVQRAFGLDIDPERNIYRDSLTLEWSTLVKSARKALR